MSNAGKVFLAVAAAVTAAAIALAIKRIRFFRKME